MKTPRVYLSLSALIIFIIFAASGTAYADSLSTPTVSLDVPAVSPLNQDEPVVQQQSKVVAKKTTTLSKAQQEALAAQAKKDALAKQLADENQAIADLKQKIADKKAADAAAAQVVQAPQPVQAAPVAQAAAPVAYTAPASSGYCVTGYSSGDYYLDKIISYESSGNSCATNAGDCFGLLQACPGKPLRDACGGDPSCQIAWFQANKTGGRSWAEVWQHELDYGWW